MNLSSELPPDVGQWREFWKRSAAQGVVIPVGNAPSPLEQSAVELIQAARDARLVVLARLDSGMLDEAAVSANPTWVARDAQGRPIPGPSGGVACVNGPYFRDLIPQRIGAIVARSRPDGVVGTGWGGLGEDATCYCELCARAFAASGGGRLPDSREADTATFERWRIWSRDQRTALWIANDRAAQQAGGRECRWTGLLPADRDHPLASLLDVPALAGATPLFFAESRPLRRTGRFRSAIDNGRRLTELAQGRPVILLTPTYHRSVRAFTLSSAPAAEARLLMFSGLAGALAPAVELPVNTTGDARSLEIGPPVLEWHRANELDLQDHPLVASVGLVWSAANASVYGREHSDLLCDAPYRGMVHALTGAHVQYRVLSPAQLTRDLSWCSALILPNIAVLSDAEAMAVRRFVERGGTLVATGETSLYETNGQVRSDYALADVLGAHLVDRAPARLAAITKPTPPSGYDRRGPTLGWLKGPSTDHSYVRLSPEYAARQCGPHKAGERAEPGARHSILAGFDETDLLAFGGVLHPLKVEPSRLVLLTYVPPFPSSPIDEVYPREERTSIPGVIVGEFGRGRVVFMPADFDRRYGIDPICDHRKLLENVFEWALGSAVPVRISGPAVVGSVLRQHGGALVLHLVNLTGADNQVGALGSYTPVGPLRVSVAVPQGLAGARVRLRVSGATPLPTYSEGRVEFEIARLVDHELVLIG